MIYSFDTSDLEEDALTAWREKQNVIRVAASLPPFEDNTAFVDAFVDTDLVGPMVSAFIEARAQKIVNAYRVANDVTRKTVDGALKV